MRNSFREQGEPKYCGLGAASLASFGLCRRSVLCLKQGPERLRSRRGKACWTDAAYLDRRLGIPERIPGRRRSKVGSPQLGDDGAGRSIPRDGTADRIVGRPTNALEQNATRARAGSGGESPAPQARARGGIELANAGPGVGGGVEGV